MSEGSWPLLTPDEVATRLSMRPGELRGLVRAHRIPHIRLSAKTVRFRHEDVEAYLGSCQPTTTPPVPVDPRPLIEQIVPMVVAPVLTMVKTTVREEVEKVARALTWIDAEAKARLVAFRSLPQRQIHSKVLIGAAAPRRRTPKRKARRRAR